MATSAMWPTRGPPRGGTRQVLTLPMGVVAGISALDQLATQRAAALTSREAGRDNAELGAIEGPPEVGPTECAASRRRLAWSFASSVHSVARTRLAEFLQRSAAALAMPHTLYYPWAPRPGERQPSTEYLRTLCDSAFVFCPRGTHEDTWRFYEAAACGAIPIVTDRSYWARFMPKDVVELLLETRCDFTLTTTGRHRDDITTCSERSFEATVDAIGALLSRPEALDARQRALREALARYDSSWRAELAVRARALEVDGEHSEAMALPSPR